MSVSRGLLTTETRSLRALLPSDDVERVVTSAVERLMSAGPGDYAWRERRDWARRLQKGMPDEFGRRIFSDEGRRDARLVARAARRAYLKGRLPGSNAAWAVLRNRIRRLHSELRRGVA